MRGILGLMAILGAICALAVVAHESHIYFTRSKSGDPFVSGRRFGRRVLGALALWGAVVMLYFLEPIGRYSPGYIGFTGALMVIFFLLGSAVILALRDAADMTQAALRSQFGGDDASFDAIRKEVSHLRERMGDEGGSGADPKGGAEGGMTEDAGGSEPEEDGEKP